MRDVTDELLDDATALERDDHRRIMAALDGMWTAFEGTEIDCLASQSQPARYTWPACGRA